VEGCEQDSIDGRRAIEAKLARPAARPEIEGSVHLGGWLKHEAARRGWQVDALLGVSRVIDAITFRIGKTLSWLILAAVIVSAVNAIIRKLFDTSSNSWLELQWVLFGAVFLLVASWTLLDNEHIRIDIVNSMFSQRTRNIIDIVGHALFLLPLTVVMIITSVPFVFKSVQLNEQSMNAGGLPQWPAKMLILLGFTLLFFQAISELIKRIAVMMGVIPDPYHTAGGLRAAAEAEVARLLAEAKAAEAESKSH
jgi:TRAP-type mannitol/chloroaromatic compound transport system permease small subunit